MEKELVRMPSIPGRPHTFVELIDRILQRRLARSQFNGQPIHLRSGKDGNLEIAISNTIYSSLEEIKNKNIRALIQASVDEWQSAD
jgi:hypothetical protein